MRRHYLAGERKADTRPFFFGRKKRYEDLFREIVWNTWAVVAHFDDDIATAIQPSSQLHSGLVEVPRGLPRVAQQIEKHGLEQDRVGVNIETGRFDGQR